MYSLIQRSVIPLLILSAYFFATQPAIAAESGQANTFTVQPEAGQPFEEIRRGYFWLKADSGASRELRVAIKNTGSTPLTLRAYGADGIAVNEGGVGYSLITQAATKTGSWLKLTPDRLQLKPGETQRVVASLLVPANTTPGEYVGGVALEDDNIQTQGAGSTVMIDVHYRQVLGVVVAVPGVVSATAVIDKVNLQPAGRGSRAVVELRNTGTVMLRPKGTIQISGAGASSQTLPFAIGTLLPNSRVSIPVDLQALTLKPGSYDVIVRVSTEEQANLADWKGSVLFAAPAAEADKVTGQLPVELAPAQPIIDAARDYSLPIGVIILIAAGGVGGLLIKRRRNHRKPAAASPADNSAPSVESVDYRKPVPLVASRSDRYTKGR